MGGMMSNKPRVSDNDLNLYLTGEIGNPDIELDPSRVACDLQDAREELKYFVLDRYYYSKTEACEKVSNLKKKYGW